MLRVYEGGGQGANRRVSAKTRSWEEAERKAREMRDSWDPEKQELKRLRAEKEAKQVSLEEAVLLYCTDLVTRLGDTGTVAMARSLLGHIDPKTKTVKVDGHLFTWLAKLPVNERPVYVQEVTPAHLTRWRAWWKFGSDLTARQRWSVAKAFFSFCESQGWIDDNPARKLKPLSVERGNRTAVFTDDQYATILDAIAEYVPVNVPVQTRKAWQQRLTTFVELLRWSGMDLIDAVLYRPELVDQDGVLRYRRQKTDVLATVPLPEHVVTLLRSVHLERDTVGPHQPFRQTDATPTSDTRLWAHRLDGLFKAAKITEVKTERGRVRTPHAKMFRDTFAVGELRNGVTLHSVAKMLGHSKTTTTEQAYLPWVKELEDAHIAAVRKARENAPKPATGSKLLRFSKR